MRKNRFRSSLAYFLGAVLQAATTLAVAQDHNIPALTEDDFFADIPVVLSATRLEQPLADAPASITIIDREMIEASGAHEIADLFIMAPGFLVATDAFGGKRRSVGYLGLIDAFSRSMQVLVDGRSVYSPLHGGVQWTDIPLSIEDIERIEIVRGPNAVAYGANAFSGIISITTTQPSDTLGHRVKLLRGENGIDIRHYHYGGTSGDLDYSLTLETEADDGFANTFRDSGDLLITQDERQLELATFRLAYRATTVDQLDIQGGSKRGTLDTGTVLDSAGTGAATDPVAKIDSDHDFMQLRWEHIFAAGNQLNLNLYHLSSEFKDRRAVTLGPLTTTLDNSWSTQRTDIEIQHHYTFNNQLRLVWGGELRKDRSRSTAFFKNGEINNSLTRIFANGEWRATPSTLINLGMMMEDNDFVDTAVSPRVAINQTIAQGHTLRSSLSHATRTPAAFEEATDWMVPISQGGTPLLLIQRFLTVEELEPETIDAFEIGYLFERSDKRLTADVRIFHNKISDAILAHGFGLTDFSNDPCDPALFTPGTADDCDSRDGLYLYDDPSTYLNSAEITIDGIELQLDYRPTKTLRLIPAYTFTHIDAKVRIPQTLTLDNQDPTFIAGGGGAITTVPTDNKVSNNKLEDSTPSNIFKLTAIVQVTPNTTGSIVFQRISRMEFLGGANATESQQRLDLRLANRFKSKLIKTGEISITIENLIGEGNIDFHKESINERIMKIALKGTF